MGQHVSVQNNFQIHYIFRKKSVNGVNIHTTFSNLIVKLFYIFWLQKLQKQVRHYKTLQEMYKNKAGPNKKDVSQLLDLELQASRAFIDCDAIKEQDKPQAYPCFRELDHVTKRSFQIDLSFQPRTIFKMSLKMNECRLKDVQNVFGIYISS